MKHKFLFFTLLILLSIRASAADDKCTYLAKAIASEMGEEPFVVRVVFGEMLLNRLNDENFPDTLPAVCFSLGIHTRNANVTDSDMRAAAAAMSNMNFGGGALYVQKLDKKSTPLEATGGVRLYDWYFY